MSDMVKDRFGRQDKVCPTNGRTGIAVDSVTLKALLVVPLTRLTSDDFRFCPDPDCLTVYYSADGQQLFGEAVLREQVYQKHPADESVLVCYCFQHTVGGIRSEIRSTGTSTAIDSITQGIRAGQCACDLRNPQGSCCLGNVRDLVKRLSSSRANSA